MKIPKGKSKDRTQRLQEFANSLLNIQKKIDFKVSSRGWCYLLENMNSITKGEFNHAQKIINTCRKQGLLPNDFIEKDVSRKFECIEENPDSEETTEYLNDWIDYLGKCPNQYNPSFWDAQNCYIQVVVEKVDLKTLFKPICDTFNIPIANAKGWSDINIRIEMIERFREAEAEGKRIILLYCGDLDPAGLLISERLKKNINDLKKATSWTSDNLEFLRFGLTKDFIEKHNLSWIENLETGSGGELARVINGEIVAGIIPEKRSKDGVIISPAREHPDFNKPYVQNYIKDIGVRKCEANAVVVIPNEARQLFRETLESYIGKEPMDEYEEMVEGKKQVMFSVVKSEKFINLINQMKELT